MTAPDRLTLSNYQRYIPAHEASKTSSYTASHRYRDIFTSIRFTASVLLICYSQVSYGREGCE